MWRTWNDGMRGYRHGDIQYRLRFQPRNRRASDVLHVQRKLAERAANAVSLDPIELGPQRRVFAQPNGARQQTEDMFPGPRIQERGLIDAGPARLRIMPFAYLAASADDRQSLGDVARSLIGEHVHG